MSNLTPRADKLERKVYGNEIEVSKISAPYTQIVGADGNPRQIPDLANNMKVGMGVERVMFDSISLLNDEFGPNGEKVYELSNKDPRVRMVGSWDQVSSTSPRIDNDQDGDFLEVIFYGTGLNLLNGLDTAGRNAYVTIDNGVESSDVYVDDSGILNSRNYKQNTILNVASGLTLGIHRVKVRNDGASLNPYNGIEILNESAQLAVNPGKPSYDSVKREILSQQLIDYNTGFDAQSDALGSKGGRVLVYQATDGSINKRLKAVSQNLAAPELISNGTFDSDVSGWTKVEGAGSGTLQHTATGGGRMEVIMPAATRVGAKTTLSGLTPGQTYEVKLDIVDAGGSGNSNVWWCVAQSIIDVANNGVNTGIAAEGNIGAAGDNRKLYFIANNATMEIAFSPNSSDNTFQFDNISVKESGTGILTSTDHSNEEVIRKINFKEFGANRGDDFSGNFTFSDKAFALDDGSTTLWGDNVASDTTDVNINASNGDSLYAQSTSTGMTLAFVGTGLDIIVNVAIPSAATRQTDITVDGAPIGTDSVSNSEPNGYKRKHTIVSGLPYGTHVVKFTPAVAAQTYGISDFIIYGPKKPELDNTDIELAEYNIMADVVPNSTPGDGNISQGMIYKNTSREFLYVGSNWSINLTIADGNGINLLGYNAQNNTLNDYVEYTFFGTGFEYRAYVSGDGATCDVTINGTPATAANFPTAVSNDFGGFTFDFNTGQTDEDAGGSGGGHSGFNITNLPLDLYTVRVTNAEGGVDGVQRFYGLGYAAPIHINDSSLKVGNLSYRDLREAVDLSDETKSKIDLGKAKAWCVFQPSGSKILNSYNISSVLEISATTYQFHFKQPFKDSTFVGFVSCANQREWAVQSGNVGQGTPQDLEGSGSGARIIASADPLNVPIMVAFFGELRDEENIDLEDL